MEVVNKREPTPANFLIDVLLDKCRRANVKSFLQPTFSGSDIPIPGEWKLATSFDPKKGPIFLELGDDDQYTSLKSLLDNWFANSAKGHSQYFVWLAFEAEEGVNGPDNSPETSLMLTPLPKVKVKVERGIKKEPGIKQEPGNTALEHVREDKDEVGYAVDSNDDGSNIEARSRIGANTDHSGRERAPKCLSQLTTLQLQKRALFQVRLALAV